jgi:NADH dehydrogenase [ubiquinone] 1 alpha subcomplex assembly factor 3
MKSQPPKTRDRGPKSDEDTQTDFSALDVLRNTIAPATSIDACTSDGFALNNQVRITGSGVLLVGGEAFRWWPWKRDGSGTGGSEDVKMEGKLLNAKGQWEVDSEGWGVLELVHPKPGKYPRCIFIPFLLPLFMLTFVTIDLLIIGTGPSVTPIAPNVRKYLNDLGIRLEIQDTRNAAAQFNLLATERGVGQVAAALIPIGWREAR